MQPREDVDDSRNQIRENTGQSIVSARGAQPQKRETLFNRVVTLEGEVANLYKRLGEIEGAIADNREFLDEALRELGLS